MAASAVWYAHAADPYLNQGANHTGSQQVVVAAVWSLHVEHGERSSATLLRGQDAHIAHF